MKRQDAHQSSAERVGTTPPRAVFWLRLTLFNVIALTALLSLPLTNQAAFGVTVAVVAFGGGLLDAFCILRGGSRRAICVLSTLLVLVSIPTFADRQLDNLPHLLLVGVALTAGHLLGPRLVPLADELSKRYVSWLSRRA